MHHRLACDVLRLLITDKLTHARHVLTAIHWQSFNQLICELQTGWEINNAKVEWIIVFEKNNCKNLCK